MARRIAQASYRFFITRPGNVKIGTIGQNHWNDDVIPFFPQERYNTIVFTPMISAQNGIMDVFMSAESQNYEASIVSATCASCPDLKISNNRISNLVFTANQPLRIDIQLDYHDYCSMEVKAYGNQV